MEKTDVRIHNESNKSELALGLEAIEGLEFKAVHMGFSDATLDWTVPHDEWRVSVTYKGKSYSSSYKAGIGHRTLARGVVRERGGYWAPHVIGGTFFGTEAEAAKAGFLKLRTPTIDDVMGCWLSDASGTDQPFEDWANNYGYDSDSRKALGIYLECQKTRAALIKMLGQELFDSLSQMEH